MLDFILRAYLDNLPMIVAGAAMGWLGWFITAEDET